MDIENENPAIFYVYILYREDGLTPFYVGKGKGARWTHHERWAKKGRSYKDNIICEMQSRGINVPRKKIAEGLTNEQACALEILTIAEFGRHPNGLLANLTDGGDGVIGLSKDARSRIGAASRERQLGKPLSEAHRAAVSLARIGVIFSDSHKKKLREARGKTVASDATKAALSAAMKGRVMTAEHRRKLSEAAKKRMLDPVQREAFRLASVGLVRSDEEREKNRKWHLGRTQSETANAKRSETMKTVWAARRGEATAGGSDG